MRCRSGWQGGTPFGFLRVVDLGLTEKVGALAMVLSAVFGFGGFILWDYLLPACREAAAVVPRGLLTERCWPYADIGLLMIALAGAMLILGLVVLSLPWGSSK